MKALTHAQVHLLIEKAADGLLTASEQRALENHLQGCAECRAYAAEFAALEAALGTVLNERWGKPQLSKSSEAEMVKALQAQYPPSAGAPPKPPGGFPTLPILFGIGLLGLLSFGLFWLASAIGFPLTSATPTPSLTASSTATPSSTSSSTATLTSSPTSSPTVLILIAIPKQNVNCRLGNSSMFDIADTLFEGEEYTPIARGYDNLWVQFRGPVTNVKCWVFVDYIDLLINDQKTPIEEVPESLLPFVAYPPAPTATFTPRPERTATFTPSPTKRGPN